MRLVLEGRTVIEADEEGAVFSAAADVLENLAAAAEMTGAAADGAALLATKHLADLGGMNAKRTIGRWKERGETGSSKRSINCS